jgi:hypothetical protein
LMAKCRCQVVPSPASTELRLVENELKKYGVLPA